MISHAEFMTVIALTALQFFFILDFSLNACVVFRLQFWGLEKIAAGIISIVFAFMVAASEWMVFMGIYEAIFVRRKDPPEADKPAKNSENANDL
ncbi:hypothetical protein GC197_03085 [bacterium]|nr:hypothetical protein [bacterium]